MTLGECYYDHFSRFLGEPLAGGRLFESAGLPSIQILAYDGPFEGCRAFCSLGLTHYQRELGQIVEVFVPVDDGWDLVPNVVGQALGSMVARRRAQGVTSALAGVSGLESWNPEFVATFGKPALYFTEPYGVSEDFAIVHCDHPTGLPEPAHGLVALGIFVTQSELDYAVAHGPAEFERLLETREVDPFFLRRPSCV